MSWRREGNRDQTFSACKSILYAGSSIRHLEFPPLALGIIPSAARARGFFEASLEVGLLRCQAIELAPRRHGAPSLILDPKQVDQPLSIPDDYTLSARLYCGA